MAVEVRILGRGFWSGACRGLRRFGIGCSRRGYCVRVIELMSDYVCKFDVRVRTYIYIVFIY